MAIKKSVGTYMSVDAAEALEQNRTVIDRIRETVQRTARPDNGGTVTQGRFVTVRPGIRFLAHQGKRFRGATIRRYVTRLDDSE